MYSLSLERIWSVLQARWRRLLCRAVCVFYYHFFPKFLKSLEFRRMSGWYANERQYSFYVITCVILSYYYSNKHKQEWMINWGERQGKKLRYKSECRSNQMGWIFIRGRTLCVFDCLTLTRGIAVFALQQSVFLWFEIYLGEL